MSDTKQGADAGCSNLSNLKGVVNDGEKRHIQMDEAHKEAQIQLK
jgi:hypothetical protein